ncbi:DUF4383 domain-containing protein [Angustibacter aerolatus]
MVDPVHTPTDLEPAPVRTVARLVGVVFLVVGVLGFVPGVTSDFSRMEMAGDPSHAMLLGIFRVSVLHNVLHLLFGVAGLVLSSHASGARWYLVGGGLAYLGLAVYGQLTFNEGLFNDLPVNLADNLLHLALGVGMIGLGAVLPGPHGRRAFGRTR